MRARPRAHRAPGAFLRFWALCGSGSRGFPFAAPGIPAPYAGQPREPPSEPNSAGADARCARGPFAFLGGSGSGPLVSWRILVGEGILSRRTLKPMAPGPMLARDSSLFWADAVDSASPCALGRMRWTGPHARGRHACWNFIRTRWPIPAPVREGAPPLVRRVRFGKHSPWPRSWVV